MKAEAGEAGDKVHSRRSIGASDKIGLHLTISWIIEAPNLRPLSASGPPTLTPALHPHKSGQQASGRTPASPCRSGWGWAAG